MMGNKTGYHIAIGFLVFLVSFITPFCPVIGGGVTAYLENRMLRSGATDESDSTDLW